MHRDLFISIPELFSSMEEVFEQGVSPKNLHESIRERLNPNRPFNFYPGLRTGECFDTAFFVTFQNSRIGGKGWPCFRDTLDSFVQHMQGSCLGVTKKAYVISSVWEPWTWENWFNNISHICKQADVEVWLYLFRGSFARLK